MRTGANFWFTLFLLALLAYGLWSVSNFPTAEARQFPTVIAVPALVLAVVQLFLDSRKRTTDEAPAAILDLPVDSSVPPRIGLLRAARAFGWILGFAGMTLLFSLYISLWLFVPPYLMVEAKASWRAALFTTAMVAFVIFGILGYGFGINVPNGLFLRRYLG